MQNCILIIILFVLTICCAFFFCVDLSITLALILGVVVFFVAAYVHEVVFEESWHVLVLVVFVVGEDVCHGLLDSINILKLPLRVPIAIKQRVIAF